MHDIFDNQGSHHIMVLAIPYPKVAGEELRTSGGTYAAVPTKVQAFSSG